VAQTATPLPGYQTLDCAQRQCAQADGAYVVDSLARLTQDSALSHRLRCLLKDRGRLVIHEREVAASQAGAILRGEPPWLAGWRLRRLVASGGWTAGELAASRSVARLEHLMLHLEPDLAPADRHAPAVIDFRSDGIDHWAGFVIV
jgi:hypothetical protein